MVRGSQAVAGLRTEKVVFFARASQAKEQIVAAGEFDRSISEGIDGQRGGSDTGQDRAYVADESANLINAVEGAPVIVEVGQVIRQFPRLVLSDVA
jgi:hypothetical protein